MVFPEGTCLYKKGWMEEAYNNFSTACNMDPGNMEYRAAMNQCQNQRNGAYGGYNRTAPAAGGCNACDMCSSLICADCCCECMGGDLIPAVNHKREAFLLSKSGKIALGGLLTALGVVLMFLTGLIPIGTYALPAIAGVLLIVAVIEIGAKWRG